MEAQGSDESRNDVVEAVTSFSSRKRGGWITFPFIAGNVTGISLALSGVTGNIIVYLINMYNVKSIDAAQISNIVNGCISLAPVAGAIVSDSYFGCFSVVAVSSFISFLGMILFTITATVRSLRPAPCLVGSPCETTTSWGQFAVLYLAVALMSIGAGGTRFNTATMGANQFDRPRDHDVFFNWYFVVMYLSSIAGSTAIVYLQDNVGWGLGFAICDVAAAAAVVVFLMGARYYRRPRPEGSPFTGLARVAVAAARNWRTVGVAEEYYYGSPGERKQLQQSQRVAPTAGFRFLNRAALKREGDTNPDGTVARPWNLCTVSQVEDLKSVLRILPLWSTSIFLAVSIGIQISLTVLQALTVDRHLTPHFSVPAGSVAVSSLAATAVSLSLLDRLFYPAWRFLARGRNLTPLQRVGIGHVLNAVGMAASALVERRRLAALSSHDVSRAGGAVAVVPMSVVWLLLPFAVVGLGEAFHFPGQVAFYYQEFPTTLRSSATGMIALIVALGFYLSTAVVDLVRKVTDWLPDDINAGRLDLVYWMLAAVAAVNFGFYVMCATLYRYEPHPSVDVLKKDAEGS